MKDAVAQLLSAALRELVQRGRLPDPGPVQPRLDRTRDPEHGDLASNIALTLAKSADCPPRELAAAIIEALPASDVIRRAEIAGPGFINFFLASDARTQVIADILDAGRAFGRSDSGAGRKVQVEFVSANPTGPLHVGHGRGAAVGDSLCRLLEATGWQVTREFYYNDAGRQIDNLALSVQARCRGLGPDDGGWPEDGYRGDYISELAADYMAGKRADAADQHQQAAADPDDLEAIRQFAVAALRHEQDLDLKAFGVQFDVFTLESGLYTEGAVDTVVARLQGNGHAYEQDGALWLRTTDFGDDKDRVMRKRDGGYTYFVPDVAYHAGKWRRGFERVINEQGADHHSTITRVRAGLQAADLGIPEGWPEYVLHQMVTVMRGGEEVKISKRAGSYVTLRDLIEWVGRDATRYFLTARRADSQLTFDVDLARAQTNDNPVFYIQYAHARLCSVRRQATEKGFRWEPAAGLEHLQRLDSEFEQALVKQLTAWPETVAAAASALEPHQIAQYLRDLAAAFHGWYNALQFLVDDDALRAARLALAEATRQVLANGLDLLGVNAPEQM